jgi:hypothetical protein
MGNFHNIVAVVVEGNFETVVVVEFVVVGIVVVVVNFEIVVVVEIVVVGVVVVVNFDGVS